MGGKLDNLNVNIWNTGAIILCLDLVHAPVGDPIAPFSVPYWECCTDLRSLTEIKPKLNGIFPSLQI